MALVIDLAIILIVALVIWRSAVHGFVRTIVELAGYILAATIAFSLAGYAADEIYERAVRPQMVSSIEQSLTDTEDQVVSQQIDSVWDSLPSVVTGLAESFGIDKEQIGAQLQDSVQNGAIYTAEMVSDHILKPVIVNFIRVFCSALLFFLLMLVVRWLARLVNRVFRLPVLSSINSLLGGVLGAVKGLILVFVLTVVIGLAMSAMGGTFLCFDAALIDQTFLYKFIYGFSPF